MTTDHQKVTLEQVKDIVRSLPDDRVNPLNEKGTCCYVGKNGERCIAGEVFHILGFDTTAEHENMLAQDVAKMFGLPPEVGGFLTQMQIFADNIDSSRMDSPRAFPRPWGEVKPALR